MKAVILAGGLGTRLSEDTGTRPKPMVEIGGRPILWHIMKIYSRHGINDFIICAGYKGFMIKEWFANYRLHNSDITVDLRRQNVDFHNYNAEPWRVTVVDTGETTATGGRIKRALPFMSNEPFCLTYGDGVADVDITTLVDVHRREGRWATITAVVPPTRFGVLEIDDARVRAFAEKSVVEGKWINGGFMVLEPQAAALIEGDDTIWEKEPLEKLAAAGQLTAHQHHGFWHPMDTLRDKTHLETLWQSGQAPWKIW